MGMGKLQEQRLLARTNSVVMRSDIEGLVQELNDNVYTVNLADKTCSCTGFQENGIPCSHAITTIFNCTWRDLVPYILEHIVSIPGKRHTLTTFISLILLTSNHYLSLNVTLLWLELHGVKLRKNGFGRRIQETKGRGCSRGNDAASDGDDEVWVPYHCSASGGQVTFLLLCHPASYINLYQENFNMSYGTKILIMVSKSFCP